MVLLLAGSPRFDQECEFLGEFFDVFNVKAVKMDDLMLEPKAIYGFYLYSSGRSIPLDSSSFS